MTSAFRTHVFIILIFVSIGHTLKAAAPPEDIGEEEEVEEEEEDIRTRQNPESDSDEEQTEELVVRNQGRRYPLRDRRAPHKFPDAKH